jgi:hypothetical protein
MLLYSTLPLIGLALLSRKYAERQARLERQYQGHMAAAEKKLEQIEARAANRNAEESTGPSEGDAPEPVEYSTAEDTIIPLKPLILIFLVVAGFAAVMLARERGFFAGGGQADESANNDSSASP